MGARYPSGELGVPALLGGWDSLTSWGAGGPYPIEDRSLNSLAGVIRLNQLMTVCRRLRAVGLGEGCWVKKQGVGVECTVLGRVDCIQR